MVDKAADTGWLPSEDGTGGEDSIQNGVRIAGVGSPSSSSEITLDLNEVGRNTKLVGSTVAIVNEMGENGQELGLGTVTEVTTHNRWHEDSTFRSARDENGLLRGMSGDVGDQRDAKIRIQASWARNGRDAEWIPGGTQLGMSPATGTGVHLVSGELIDDIIAQVDDVHYDGFLGGSDNIPLPLYIPDNATPQGALHFGVFGRSGSGKALALDTPIPTPDGWKNIGNIVDGDIVYDENGLPCRVLQAHPILYDRVCYTVRFDDNSAVVADGEHYWAVLVDGGSELSVLSTRAMFEAQKLAGGTPPRYSIPLAAAITKFPSGAPEDLSTSESYRQMGKTGWAYSTLANSHEYDASHAFSKILRGSPSQREKFLEGTLDYARENKAFTEIVDTVACRGLSQNQANFLHELAASLGYMPILVEEYADADGKGYLVRWDRNVRGGSNDRHRAVRSVALIEETVSVPVRCLTVDSPSRLYLAGTSFIPTHNTAAATYVIAGQMRHDKMGMVIVDPQGQWAAEHSLPFSVQGFAEELGREVTVARVSEDLRLKEDSTLFRELLDQTTFYNKLRVKHPQTQDIVGDEIVTILSNLEKWSELDSSDLLRTILASLASDTVSGRVYTTESSRERFVETIEGILASNREFANIRGQFHPIANLFQDTNAWGETRKPLWEQLKKVFDRKPGVNAPILILDMSSRSPEIGEEMSADTESAYTILDSDSMKAAILRNLFATLKRESEKKFRNNENLNTLIVLDEAWRYAAPLAKISQDEKQIFDLSKDLAGYARDTRKFGISWFYISQSPRSINQDIWEQIHIFLFGTGLNGADLEKATEAYEDKQAALRLYKRFGNPIATGIWPFLLQGPVSPLMSANAPLVLNMYTSFDDFRRDNDRWIRTQRSILGKEVLTGSPRPPASKVLKKGHVRRGPKTTKDAISIVKKANEHDKHNTDVGVGDPNGFSDPLANF